MSIKPQQRERTLDITHLVATGGREVAQVDMPGEQWVGLFDPELEPEFAAQLTNGVRMPNRQGVSPVIEIQKFEELQLRQPRVLFFAELAPYIRRIKELGYQYLVFAN